MPWSGAGVFNRTDGVHLGSDTWAKSAAAGENVRSDRADVHDEDIATGLENCLTRDGQNSPSANLPMSSRRHTGVGNAGARTEYAAAGQVQDGALTSLAVSGADTLTASPSPAIPAYALGQRFSFKIAETNTGAVTLDINALGAKAVVKAAGAALDAGDLTAGDVAEVVYDGEQFQLVAVSVGPSALRDIGTAAGNLVALDGDGLVPASVIPSGVLAKTDDYTVTSADVRKTLLCDASSAAFTVTLPDLGSDDAGFTLGVMKTDSSANLVSVDGDGSDTINGGTSVVLGRQHEAVELRWDGSAWRIFADAAEPDLSTLTDAATIAWNAGAHPMATVTLAGNRTLGAPTGAVEGGIYVLRVVQDGTGSRTLSFSSTGYEFGDVGTPNLSTDADAFDLLPFLYAGGKMRGFTPSLGHT